MFRPLSGHLQVISVHKIKIELNQDEVAILSLTLCILMPEDEQLVVETCSPRLTKYSKQLC